MPPKIPQRLTSLTKPARSLPFRLLLESDGWSGDPKAASKKKAIEIWHLYSYNLHKATYHGLNTLHRASDKLAWRDNRRNFIIGRGSFVGMHRYAGLWTGDNASTWQFLQISVAQVLAIGLSGITISGADVGGFEFMSQETKSWADPELLIRWYCAYSLLPWFRCVFTELLASPHPFPRAVNFFFFFSFFLFLSSFSFQS